jgi:hypothetical protein
MKYYFLPDKSVIIISIIIIIAIGFMVQYIIHVNKWYIALPTVLAVVLFIFFFLKTPYCTEVTTDSIKIKKIFGQEIFKKEDIQKIEIIKKEDLEGGYRKMGNGGFFGYSGFFYAPKIGNFQMITINQSELAKITMNTGKIYIINYPHKLLDEP